MDWTSVKLSFEPPRASMIKYVIVFLGNRSQDPLKVRCELYAKSKVFYRCYFAFFLDDRLYMYNQKCSRKSCTNVVSSEGLPGVLGNIGKISKGIREH